MDSEQIPERSNLWFSKNGNREHVGKIFDNITVVYSLVLAVFSFVLFWPLVSKINFEEAFFTPLVPFLIGFIVDFSVPVNDAMKAIFIASFVVSACGVYFLVRDLTKRQVAPILASLIYLIPPIPIFVFSYLRPGQLTQEVTSAQRFLTTVYGDVAHLLGLALVPFVILFFLRYLKSSSKKDFLLCVVLIALVLLSNRSQAVYMLIVLVIAAFSEFFLGLVRLKIKRVFLVILFAFGLVSFWYTPTFWVESALVFYRQMASNFQFLFPLPFIIGLLSIFFSFVFFGKKQERQAIFVFFLLFVVFLVMTFVWLVNAKPLVIHPQRLIPDLNMFFSVVLAMSLTALIDKLGLVTIFSFERWGATARVIGSLVFGFLSLVILSACAYFLSPLFVGVFSGSSGVWSRINQEVISDRELSIKIAGGNFQLLNPSVLTWEIWFGVFLSVFTLFVMTILIFRKGGIIGERVSK